ncbi:hypothetical protein RHMOL_Rhmol10G0018200 [Rhododendron molle]|uniref:Uncharacterized protein n=1 Tax=Rhododendron molle TaxID=49168 RepID=A0ACC0LYY2_RHOML|nr:hypothetical protein RHMOL_Rhmol10G0018200 [Rhododendron molle]
MSIISSLLDNDDPFISMVNMCPVLSTPIDWKGTSEAHVVVADLPGLKKEDVKVEGVKDDWGSNGGGLWTVPQISINNGNIGNMKVKTEEVILQGGEDEWKQVRAREASVLRYKEKRQNRLFAERIRYEVRKINAEKRPRMKGRFVKRS